MKRDPVRYRHCKEVLAASPLFQGLSETLLDDMLSLFRYDQWRRRARPAPRLFRERFPLLIDGCLEVMRVNPESGKAIMLALLSPGDGIDTITLLNGRPHEVTPVVMDDIELISVPIAVARAWIAEHPEFNRNFLPYLAEQMRCMEDLATDLEALRQRAGEVIVAARQPCDGGAAKK